MTCDGCGHDVERTLLVLTEDGDRVRVCSDCDRHLAILSFVELYAADPELVDMLLDSWDRQRNAA